MRLSLGYVGPGTEPPRRTRAERARWWIWRLRRMAPYWKCYVFGHQLKVTYPGMFKETRCRRCKYQRMELNK